MYTHLIHIADLHIRSGDIERARIKEYHHVFQNFIDNIASLECITSKSALIVIAGDIFHNKGRIDVDGLTLLFKFIDNLLKLAPVICICGNHDFRQDNAKSADSLEMLETVFNNKNLHYLKNTGLYEFDNVGFGVVSIKDVLKATAGSGIVEELPKYPDIAGFSVDIQTKVALFHGTISDTIYPLEWFSGYDIGVFGDIHKQQIHKSILTWGYPGSLVQQDDGESTEGHGYLLWNLKSNEVTVHHIYNQYGCITMRKKETIWFVRIAPKKVIEYSEAIKLDYFPKTPKIRILGNRTLESEVCDLLTKDGIYPISIRVTDNVGITVYNDFDTDIEGNVSVAHKLSAIGDLNHKDNWRKYIEQVFPSINCAEIIDNPAISLLIPCAEGMPTEIKTKIKNRNDLILEKVATHETENKATIFKPSIRIKYMAWNYILCYGKDNYIDFTNQDRKIILINGANATGKSAFFDVIALGFFGEPTSLRTQVKMGKKLSVKYINDQKPKHESANISITFSYGDEIYEIHRSFKIRSKDIDLIDFNLITISRIEDGNEKTIIAEGAFANTWVAKHFGSLHSLELSNMMCQIDSNNFFAQSNDSQRDIIEHALNLDNISTYSEILAEAKRAYKYIINEIATFKSGMSEHAEIVLSPDDIKKYEKLKEKISRLITVVNECDKIRMTIGKPPNINEKYLELSEKLLLKNIKIAEEYLASLELSQEQYNQFVERRSILMHQLKDTAANNNGAESEAEASDEADAEAGDEPIREMTIEAIQRMQTRCNKWQAAQDSKWLENPDEIEIYQSQYIDKYTEKVEYLEKLIISRPRSKTNKESMILSASVFQESMKLLQKKQTDLIELMKRKIVPCRQKENEGSWKSSYKSWLSKIGDSREGFPSEDLRKRLTSVKEYIDFITEKEVRLEEIVRRIEKNAIQITELSSLPYNHDCDACRQQPHRKRLNELLENDKVIKREQIKIQKYLDMIDKSEVEDIKQEFEDLPKIIKQREFYESTAETIEAEANAWQQAEKQWKDVEEHTEIAKNLEEEILSLEWDIYNTHTQMLKKTRATLETYKDSFERMKTFLIEYDSYREDLCVIEDNLKSIAVWNRWDAIRKKKAANELKIISEKINKWQSANNEIERWNKVKIYAEYKKADMEYQKQSEALQNAREEYTRLDKSLTDMKSYKIRIGDIVKLHDDLVNKYETIKQVYSCIVGDPKKNIEGFRDWIFTTEALPLLQREINSFLSQIDKIQITITYNNTGTKSTSGFVYMITDRGNAPSINTISGYQKFIINIAMRIALSCLGTNGINFETLFIDEGFTSFDNVNINKIQEIFDILLQKYNNIMIVSHMDLVRDMVESRIDIERNDTSATSRLQYGEIYPVYKKPIDNTEAAFASVSVNTEKRRGRPKK